jgi:ElaB/YqjD/DUF883 family membrane-anchored ribosome-binding protein
MENVIKKSDLDALTADVERLKKDLAKTLDHVKTATEHMKNAAVNNAVNGAANIADHLSDEANEIYRNMAKRGDKAAKAIGRQVEEQPITSLLVAFSAGFILSKLTDRH